MGTGGRFTSPFRTYIIFVACVFVLAPAPRLRFFGHRLTARRWDLLILQRKYGWTTFAEHLSDTEDWHVLGGVAVQRGFKVDHQVVFRPDSSGVQVVPF